MAAGGTGTDLDRQTDKGSTRWTTVNVKSKSSATFDPVDQKLCFLLLQALLLTVPSSVTHETEVEGAQATSGSAVTHHTCDPCWAYGAGATARLWDYRQLASALMCAHVKFCLPVCLSACRPRPRQPSAVVSGTDWERRADHYGCDLEEVSPSSCFLS